MIAQLMQYISNRKLIQFRHRPTSKKANSILAKQGKETDNSLPQYESVLNMDIHHEKNNPRNKLEPTTDRL